MGLSLLVVFLVLAALYESWAIPLSGMLVVPLGMLGAVALMNALGMSNDVYFLVGMVAVIGLAAKNAIFIVEFAKDLYARGMSLHDAAVEAARAGGILCGAHQFAADGFLRAVATGAGCPPAWGGSAAGGRAGGRPSEALHPAPAPPRAPSAVIGVAPAARRLRRGGGQRRQLRRHGRAPARCRAR